MKKRQINFIDKRIIDCLILFTHSPPKFAADGIPTDLATKVTSHLKPINHDRWAELEFKHKLTGVEKKNMAVIGRVYQRLGEDEEIKAQIEKIKEHPWVRVVEGDE